MALLVHWGDKTWGFQRNFRFSTVLCPSLREISTALILTSGTLHFQWAGLYSFLTALRSFAASRLRLARSGDERAFHERWKPRRIAKQISQSPIQGEQHMKSRRLVIAMIAITALIALAVGSRAMRASGEITERVDPLLTPQSTLENDTNRPGGDYRH